VTLAQAVNSQPSTVNAKTAAFRPPLQVEGIEYGRFFHAPGGYPLNAVALAISSHFSVGRMARSRVAILYFAHNQNSAGSGASS
jgi:hypothetical protein